MSNLKGKQALIGVAEWLEAGAPHVGDVAGFDLSVGVQMADPACGTVCCIAGALVQFNEPVTEKLISQIDYDDDDTEYNWGTIFDKGMEIAGLTEDQAGELFEPSDFNRSEIKPEQAAKVIRHYLSKGVVNWDVIYED